jgi:serine/threonine-protein kinase
MSPEQAQGKSADARSDIFSFGLVLYEMLSGRKAFSGESPVATALAVVKDEPPQIKASRALEKIVRQCLAKHPEERYQTISGVKKALEKAVEKVPIGSAELQPSIAVLPFADMSPGKDNEWFSDGLAEEIINALTQIPELKVIARTSAFAFKGKEQDITKIAEALRVNTILEGSVRKAGDRIRVTAQLINANDGSHLWSERYDRDMADVFAIQDEISQAIAEKLRVQLSKESRPDKRGKVNVEAYNQCLKGRYHFYRLTDESLAKCEECSTRATIVDPDYALAWYWLAKYYWYMGFSGRMPREISNRKSSQTAIKALELDEMLPEAHSMLGAVHAIEFDWKEAEREFRDALELDPKSQEAWINYAWFYLIPMRRVDEAIIAMEKVLAIDPLDLISHGLIGNYYYFIQQWDSAIEHWNTVLDLDANNRVHMWLGLAYVQKGAIEEGIRLCETALRLYRIEAIGWVSLAFSLAGRFDAAHELLEELLDYAGKGNTLPTFLSIAYFGLGEIDQSFDWLEKAFDEHNDRIFYVLGDSVFDPLRSHPRYKALLRKMNLES